MRFPPVSDSLLFSKNFLTVKILKHFTFSRKISRFSSAKIPDDLFLVIDHKFQISFRISPYFSCFSTFPPLFRENYYFPLLWKISLPVLEKFTCFLHAFCVFRFPLTLTMMHLCITHPMHVLDAHGCRYVSFIGFLQFLGLVSLALLLPIFRSLFVLSSSCPGRRSLRSASRGDYLIPRSYTATKQNRTFSAAGPFIWNSLPLELRSLPRDFSRSFYSLLKAFLFPWTWAGSASE